MPIDAFDGYVKAMSVIKGEEMLQKLEVVTYPKLKNDKDRNIIKKHYFKMANQNQEEAVSGHEMARKLKQWQMKK